MSMAYNEKFVTTIIIYDKKRGNFAVMSGLYKA
jgi:hypothetical protein